MTDPSAAPPAPLSPMFIWTELNRRTDVIALRLDRLDEHGTRGVDQLRDQVARVAADIGDHERAHAAALVEQQTARRWLIGILVAVVTPLYPLLIWLITRGR